MSRKFNLEAVREAALKAGYSAPFGDEEGTIEVLGHRGDGTCYAMIVWSQDGAVFTEQNPEGSRKALAAYDAILERLKIELTKGWREESFGLGRMFRPDGYEADPDVVVTLRHGASCSNSASLLHKLADWLADQ